MSKFEWNLYDAKRVWAKEGIETGIEEMVEIMSKRGIADEYIAEDTKIDEDRAYIKTIEKSVKDCIKKGITEEDGEKLSGLMAILFNQFALEDTQHIYSNNGKKYAKEAIAEKMVKRGRILLEFIAQDTGLPIEEIEQIANKYK